jgi:glycosyltransferase involved in cell wall biosynthesis
LPRNRIAEAVANTGTDPSENPAVALLCLDDLHQLEIARLCSANGVPYVYISEYSLKTRWQIVDATVSNPIKRLRRRFWELGQERKRAKALSGAAGLQANGIPTYDDYKAICPEALLFFDTRVTAGMLATEDQVRRKAVAAGRPLKLMFSGRLVRMKGVMDLIAVAKELRRLHIDFHLSICGAGDLSGRLDQAIRTEDLTRHVTLEGALDFADELVPLSKGSIDLFVCCHPQGDPSCTYLETMSCGVPIVGYANDAFAGLVRYSGAGWLTPLNRPDLLAAEIQRISQTPGAILEMALRSLQFAAEHTFEREFAKRMNQLQTVADRSFPAD